MSNTPPTDRFAALAAAERFRQALVHGDPAALAAADAELKQQADALVPPAQDTVDESALVRGDEGPVTRSAGKPVTVQLRMTHVPLGMVDLFDETERPLISVTAPAQRRTRVRVSAGVEGFSTAAVGTLETAADAREPTTLHLLPTFAQAHAARLTRPVRAAARVTVHELDGQRLLEERTFRLWLLPPSTAVIFEKDPSTGKWSSLAEYLAGWVTPDDPAVMAVLRKAAELTTSRSIAGYQHDAAGVLECVRAIYSALQSHGLIYLNSIAANGAADAFVQRVRPPAESLRDRGANCLDGAVLYASLFEAASLQAGIVLIPGHAYAAWRPSDAAAWRFLETTMTGTRGFDESLEQAEKMHAAWATRADTRILDIAALRRRGILSMG